LSEGVIDNNKNNNREKKDCSYNRFIVIKAARGNATLHAPSISLDILV
jgi:hypothetical protein